ncbi:DNA topoisomerase IB [Leucobacter viscericola]|uniref:DNA topoisomerase n=1 Tax=Leucobacter viscericola TaxID=2714935 RepID=A0A6G7XEH3_9MICO|nr:DNA topoisomerase IB [Leucobacter viscericola]QIK62849.1 DNA topoisomerase IB [Leucobacter viscericola]
MAKRIGRRTPITRELTDEGFIYRLGKRRITKRSELKRIEALVIPPAWTEVEIAQSASAKVLARGVDAAGRTQAIYHPAFRRRQDRLKFDRMQRFGRALPRLRAQVDRDLRRRRLSRSRVTACAIRLIDLQLFRVGNAEYAAQHKSYGITTLRRKHLAVGATGVEFDFVGKSGKRQRRRVRDSRTARILAQLAELPGQEVFRFFDEDGVVHSLRSSHVNDYVKKHMGEEFTAKDFRTWGGTVTVATALLELDPRDLASEKARAAAARDAIALAAEKLGNTVAVTRGSYVDPRVLSAVERPGVLERVKQARIRPSTWLDPGEQRTMRLIAEMGRAR